MMWYRILWEEDSTISDVKESHKGLQSTGGSFHLGARVKLYTAKEKRFWFGELIQIAEKKKDLDREELEGENIQDRLKAFLMDLQKVNKLQEVVQKAIEDVNSSPSPTLFSFMDCHENYMKEVISLGEKGETVEEQLVSVFLEMHAPDGREKWNKFMLGEPRKGDKLMLIGVRLLHLFREREENQVEEENGEENQVEEENEGEENQAEEENGEENQVEEENEGEENQAEEENEGEENQAEEENEGEENQAEEENEGKGNQAEEENEVVEVQPKEGTAAIEKNTGKKGKKRRKKSPNKENEGEENQAEKENAKEKNTGNNGKKRRKKSPNKENAGTNKKNTTKDTKELKRKQARQAMAELMAVRPSAQPNEELSLKETNSHLLELLNCQKNLTSGIQAIEKFMEKTSLQLGELMAVQLQPQSMLDLLESPERIDTCSPLASSSPEPPNNWTPEASPSATDLVEHHEHVGNQYQQYQQYQQQCYQEQPHQHPHQHHHFEQHRNHQQQHYQQHQQHQQQHYYQQQQQYDPSWGSHESMEPPQPATTILHDIPEALKEEALLQRSGSKAVRFLTLSLFSEEEIKGGSVCGRSKKRGHKLDPRRLRLIEDFIAKHFNLSAPSVRMIVGEKCREAIRIRKK